MKLRFQKRKKFDFLVNGIAVVAMMFVTGTGIYFIHQGPSSESKNQRIKYH